MTAGANEVLFDSQKGVAPLGLIATESATELGDKINGYLMRWLVNEEENPDGFLIGSECPRLLLETVRV